MDFTWLVSLQSSHYKLANSKKERKNIPHLVAKTRPNNTASTRVLEKCGGRKGELVGLKNNFKDFKKGEAEGDMDGFVQCWYFDRAFY